MQVIKKRYDFLGPMIPPAVASVTAGPWCSKDTSVAGSPTIAAANGFMDLTLDAQNEAQNLCLYWGDILAFDIDDLISVDIWAKLTASLNAAITASFGVASARNDVLATMDAYALFECVGANTVKFGSDDTVNVVAPTLTGHSLSTTVKKFHIDFAGGVKTVSGGLSTGGKSKVLLSQEDASGNLRRVLDTTNVDMSNYASGLQLFAQLQKTAATAVATLSIQAFEVALRVPT